jgi:hypothetical protein
MKPAAWFALSSIVLEDKLCWRLLSGYDIQRCARNRSAGDGRRSGGWLSRCRSCSGDCGGLRSRFSGRVPIPCWRRETADLNAASAFPLVEKAMSLFERLSSGLFRQGFAGPVFFNERP